MHWDWDPQCILTPPPHTHTQSVGFVRCYGTRTFSAHWPLHHIECRVLEMAWDCGTNLVQSECVGLPRMSGVALPCGSCPVDPRVSGGLPLVGLSLVDSCASRDFLGSLRWIPGLLVGLLMAGALEVDSPACWFGPPATD